MLHEFSCRYGRPTSYVKQNLAVFVQDVVMVVKLMFVEQLDVLVSLFCVLFSDELPLAVLTIPVLDSWLHIPRNKCLMSL